MMTAIARKLYQEALTLAVDDRANLAALLIESLDPKTEDGVEAAWRVEVGKRVAALDAGEVQPVAWEDAEEMIFGDLSDLQSTP